MDHFKRDLLKATSDQLTKSRHEVLGRACIVSGQVHMKRAAGFQMGLKADKLKACNTPTNLNPPKESWSLPVDNNPYASPAAVNSVDAPLTDAEAIRTRYLSHEASVKSIGTLYMLGAILMVLSGGVMLVVMLVGVLEIRTVSAEAAILAVACFFYLGLGILQGATAMGIRKLQNWARYVAVVFSVIGLLGFPIGTIISAYFLYLLLSQKGTMVFSDEYKEIIAATPHLKYKTSIIVIILLILLVVILVFGALALVLAG